MKPRSRLKPVNRPTPQPVLSIEIRRGLIVAPGKAMDLRPGDVFRSHDGSPWKVVTNFPRLCWSDTAKANVWQIPCKSLPRNIPGDTA